MDSRNPQQNRVDLDGRVSIDEDGNLLFAHVLKKDEENGWIYFCQAWSSVLNYKKFGSATRIYVQQRAEGERPKTKPEISYTNAAKGNNKVTVMEGETLSLYCIIKGYPTITITWSKQGGLPANNEMNGNTRLFITKVQNNDMYNGVYTCRGENSQGFTEQIYDVEVLMIPKFLVGPKMVKNTNVTVGGAVEFVCDVEARPPAEITWRVNNISIHAGSANDPRMTVSSNRFKMVSLQKDEEGKRNDLQVVTCEAGNSQNGKEIGTRFISGYVNVLLPLEMVAGPKDYKINSSDDDTILQCVLKSDPSKPPEVTWIKDGKDLKVVPGAIIYQPDNSLKLMRSGFNSVDDVVGEYTCKATTSAPDQMVTAKCQVTAAASGSVIGLSLAAMILAFFANAMLN